MLELCSVSAMQTMSLCPIVSDGNVYEEENLVKAVCAKSLLARVGWIGAILHGIVHFAH